MNMFLAMHPFEFLLRYTVIIGMLVAIVGAAICMMAKRITMAKRQQAEFNKNDKFYSTLIVVGVLFILAGMIIIALPYRATFYKG